jgi:hypothetical protein
VPTVAKLQWQFLQQVCHEPKKRREKNGENKDHEECEEEQRRKETIRTYRRKGSRKRTRSITWSIKQINLGLVGSIF